MTMTLVSTITVGAGGAASIEFTGIPQTGQDLLIVVSARSSASSSQGNVQVNTKFNGVGGTSYSDRMLFSQSGTVSSSSSASAAQWVWPQVNAGNTTASTFGSMSIYIANYTSASPKSGSVDIVTENNSATQTMGISAGSFTGSAITSMSMADAFGGTLVQYSTASLYTISTTGATGASVA